MHIWSISLLLLIQLSRSFEQTCSKISISTNITSTKSDVVYNGEVKQQWVENSPAPAMSQSSLEFDYFYLTVVDTPKTLSSKDIKLVFDDLFFADTVAEIKHKKELSSNVRQYSVMIKYRCKQYGGALINYELDITVPDCGTTKVYWKKVCGNPLTYRQGLSMDLSIRKFNQTIVRNGMLMNASYFDSDLENFVFRVPPKMHQSIFYVYMDIDDSVDYAAKIQQEKDEYAILSDVMMLIPEERIGEIYVDGDELLVNPTITSELQQGGLITKQKQKITVTYNCQRKGDSWIQLTIPLLYFRDINVFVIKECSTQYFLEAFDVSARIGWFATLFLLSLLACVIATVYNLYFRHKKGWDAVPLVKTALQQSLRFEAWRNTEAAQYLQKEILKNHYKKIDAPNEPSSQEIDLQEVERPPAENSGQYGSL